MRISAATVIASTWCVILVACNQSNPPASFSGPAALPYSVSGVVTEYRGGPLEGAAVKLFPNGFSRNNDVTHLTGEDGLYRFDGLSDVASLEVTRAGYVGMKTTISALDKVVNFPLRRKLALAAGGSLAATVWGDDAPTLDELTCQFGCVVVSMTSSAAGTLRSRLEWNDAINRLDLTVLGIVGISYAPMLTARGASPVELSTNVRDGETLLVIGFSNWQSGLPPSSIRQDFHLSTLIN